MWNFSSTGMNWTGETGVQCGKSDFLVLIEDIYTGQIEQAFFCNGPMCQTH